MGAGFWFRWSWRDLRRHLLQVIAIAAILGLGSAIYSGLSSTSAWRRRSLAASLGELAVHDVRVDLLGDTVTDADRLVPAVVTSAGRSLSNYEARLVVRTPVTARDLDGVAIPAAGELVGVDLSTPPTVDRWAVVAGRNLSASDAGQPVALLDLNFARNHGLPDTGDLRVDGTDIHYVGLAQAPDYFNLTMTAGEVVQGKATRAVLYTSLELARRIRGTEDGVNDVVLRVSDGADANAVASSLTRDLPARLPGVPFEVTTRSADRSMVAIRNEIDSEQRVFEVFALFILVGATFAAFGLTKRVVESQRRDIGIAMSLGLPPARVAIRPTLFAAEVTILGVGFGVAAGVGISRWVLSIIQQQNPLPLWETPFQTAIFLRAALATLIIPMVAAGVPIIRAVRAKPVDAFLPSNLRTGGNRLSGAMRRLRLPGTMLLQAPLRRILRAPMRSVSTVIAVALVMAPLLAALGAGDSTTKTINAADEIVGGPRAERLLVSLVGYQPDGSPALQEIQRMPGVGHMAPGLDVGGYVRNPTKPRSAELGVSISMIDLADLLTAPPGMTPPHPSPGGIVISQKAADDLGVSVGDEITLRHPRREGTTFVWGDSRVPVRAVHPSPYRFVAYMDITDRSLFGLDGLVGSLKIQPAPGTSTTDLQARIAALPGIASVLPASAVSQTTRDILSTLRQLFLILQAVIAALAFLVAFNASRVAADERRRENATTFAFGIPVRRVLGMEVSESLMLGTLGGLLGLGLGVVMLRVVLETVFPSALPDLAVRFVITPTSFVLTIGIALLATSAAPLLNVRSLRHMDLPSTLRYVE
jgi:putative ABC transport system permease protein